MVNRNLMRQVDLTDDLMENEINAAFETALVDPEHGWLLPDTQIFEVNKIVKGRVLNVVGDEVMGFGDGQVVNLLVPGRFDRRDLVPVKVAGGECDKILGSHCCCELPESATR